MNYLRFTNTFLYLIGSLILLLNSCKKDSNTSEKPINKNDENEILVVPTEIKLITDSVKPYELIIFKFKEAWTKPPDSIGIGSIRMEVKKQDSLLVGVCPELLPGEYPLIIDSLNFTTNIHLSSFTLVQPQLVYDSMLKKLDNLKKLNNSDLVLGLETTFKNEWLKLSASDQNIVAQMISANNLLSEELDGFEPNKYIDSILKRSASLEDIYDYLSKRHTMRVIKTVASAGIFAAGIYAGPWGAAFAVGGAVSFLNQCALLSEEVGEFGHSIVRFQHFYNVTDRSNIKVIKGKAKPITITGSYKNTSIYDDFDNTLSSFFQYLNQAQSAINGYNIFVTRINSYFSTTLSTIDWNLKDQLAPMSVKNSYPIANKFVNLVKVEPSRFKVQLLKVGSSGYSILAEGDDNIDTLSSNFTIYLQYGGSSEQMRVDFDYDKE